MIDVFKRFTKIQTNKSTFTAIVKGVDHVENSISNRILTVVVFGKFATLPLFNSKQLFYASIPIFLVLTEIDKQPQK